MKIGIVGLGLIGGSMARALRGAVAPEKGFEDEIPSTKGTLI